MRFLVDRGLSPFGRQKDGRSALLWASRNGRAAVVDWLLDVAVAHAVAGVVGKVDATCDGRRRAK